MSKSIIKVVSFWEEGWNTPIKEFDLWHYPLKDFDVDGFYMVPVSGIFMGKAGNVLEKEKIEDVFEENEDLVRVFVDEKGEQNLKEFNHPDNALYVFGKTSSSLLSHKTKDDVSVRIETPIEGGMLWGHQACSIVLYDRFIKLWQQ